MTGNHLAIVSPDGHLVGQAVRYRDHLLASLHVVDPRQSSSRLRLMDAEARGLTVTVEPVRISERGDIAVLRPSQGLSAVSGSALIVAGEAACKAPIDIIAIVPTEQGLYGLSVLPAVIVGLHTVSAYAYGTSCGRRLALEDCDVVFLSVPVPRGWSGAVVMERRTNRMVGTIHGNAEANGGNAVCLLPGSAFWQGL